MRILIAQTSFLGDVVLSTPVFAAVRRLYPEAHIAVLVRRDTAGVLAGHPHVDAVLVDDKRGRDRGLGGWRVVQMLRRQHFDVALALHKSFRTAWILAAAHIPRRIGFRQSAGWFLYHHRVPRDRTRHDVERNLQILAGLNADPDSLRARPFVACQAEAVARVRALLQARGVAPGTHLIGVAPGSAWATKRWTVAGYATLVGLLQQRADAAVLLLGAPADADYAAAIAAAARAPVANLVGETDLATLIAAIDQCTVLVTNDSAPMHIAVARDTPVVAIFGPTTPTQGYGPYTDRAVVVQRDLSCRPCGRHGAAVCPIGTHACMRDITADEVAAAVATLRSTHATAAPRSATRP